MVGEHRRGVAPWRKAEAMTKCMELVGSTLWGGQRQGGCRPGEVDEVVGVLGQRGIDQWDSDAGELTGDMGPPCNVNGEPTITSGFVGGIHGTAAWRR